jgi:DNA-binding beta-propeller fold protein YncE
MKRAGHDRAGAMSALAAATVLGLAACAGKGPRTAVVPVLYPPAPDTARVQFLTFITSERDLGRGRSAFSKVVGATDQVKAITKPYGLAVRGDKWYVCDEGILGINIVDFAKREISFFQPPTPHPIQRAINCAVDEDGNLYVTDTGAKSLHVYDSTGSFVADMGTEDGGTPVDVMVVGDRIYVSHLSGERRIRVYERATRALLFGFPDAKPADSIGLAAPANLFVAGDSVYVSDLIKQQVFVYTTGGQFVRTIGRPGLGPATFSRPKGISVSRDGVVYVVDGAFDNVQLFDTEGRALMFFGGPGDKPGNMVLPAKVVLDYDHLDRFRQYVAPGYDLKYLILVTNQFGLWKVGVYGFVERAGTSPAPGVGP